MMPKSIKCNAIKSLIVLSKYLGLHKEFSNRLKEYDIKLPRPDALGAFLRILNASNSNIMQYYDEVIPLLRNNNNCMQSFY